MARGEDIGVRTRRVQWVAYVGLATSLLTSAYALGWQGKAIAENEERSKKAAQVQEEVSVVREKVDSVERKVDLILDKLLDR